MFAGLITTSSSALVTMSFITWGVIWGVISLTVIGVWLRPRLVWLLLGLLGPLGPIVALIVGFVGRERNWDV